MFQRISWIWQEAKRSEFMEIFSAEQILIHFYIINNKSKFEIEKWKVKILINLFFSFAKS